MQQNAASQICQPRLTLLVELNVGGLCRDLAAFAAIQANIAFGVEMIRGAVLTKVDNDLVGDASIPRDSQLQHSEEMLVAIPAKTRRDWIER